MRVRRPLRPAVILVPLLAVLMAGCVQEDPHTEGPSDPVARHPLPAVALALEDARSDPLDAATVRTSVLLDRPLVNETSLHVTWTLADAVVHEDTRSVPPNITRLTFDHVLDGLPPGDHDLGVTASWTNTTPAGADIAIRVWAPLRLILDAPEKHAAEQNAFHSDLTIPFAPWDRDSALDILLRAAERHDFEVETTYRADMEAHFVDAINGTAFYWEVEAAGISRNWMLLVDDTLSNNAVDHTYPKEDQVVTFRYTRCSAAGCEDV